MTSDDSLTTTSLLAQASEILKSGDYQPVASSTFEREESSVRYFEDAYGVVGVSVYETWDALWSEWREDEAELANLISEHWSRSDPKAWDGYLVLLTPGRAGIERRAEISSLRYNTSTVRKLVGSGDEMDVIGDVKRVLLPLLPLDVASIDDDQPGSSLDRLPCLLTGANYSTGAVESLISAFHSDEPLMEKLHLYLTDCR